MHYVCPHSHVYVVMHGDIYTIESYVKNALILYTPKCKHSDTSLHSSLYSVYTYTKTKSYTQPLHNL